MWGVAFLDFVAECGMGVLQGGSGGGVRSCGKLLWEVWFIAVICRHFGDSCQNVQFFAKSDGFAPEFALLSVSGEHRLRIKRLDREFFLGNTNLR